MRGSTFSGVIAAIFSLSLGAIVDAVDKTFVGMPGMPS